MAVESLYTTQTPDGGSGDLADLTGGGSTATTVKFLAAGNVTGGRFFAPATTGGATFRAELWEVSSDTTGTLLASKAYSAVTGAAWNTVLFDAAVAVATNKVYRVATHNSAGRYVARAGQFAAELTNGNVVGIQANTTHTGASGALFNGTFQIGAAGTFPGTHFGSPSYLADVLFEASASTIDGVLTAVGPRPVVALAGTSIFDATLAAAGPRPVVAAAGDLVVDGVLAAVGPRPRLVLIDQVVVEPGTLTAGGRPVSTLTPGGRP